MIFVCYLSHVKLGNVVCERRLNEEGILLEFHELQLTLLGELFRSAGTGVTVLDDPGSWLLRSEFRITGMMVGVGLESVRSTSWPRSTS